MIEREALQAELSHRSNHDGITIALLSAGAALGLVQTVQPDFERRQNCKIDGQFGAVGAMQERLLAGAPCDVVVSSHKVMGSLIKGGWVIGGSVRPVGRVSTAVAILAGKQRLRINDAASLVLALKAASGVYLPDMKRSTAGRHMRKVLEELRILAEIRTLLHEFENGAAAMRAMVENGEPGPLGCTQATEILYTPGVELVAYLPEEVGLETLYEVGVTNQSDKLLLASDFTEFLSGPSNMETRCAAGFR